MYIYVWELPTRVFAQSAVPELNIGMVLVTHVGLNDISIIIFTVSYFLIAHDFSSNVLATFQPRSDVCVSKTGYPISSGIATSYEHTPAVT